tara:strand:- start:2557 stop:2751 length:195 start_codon:yes stop_codon:yes gene_type:complete
MVVEEGEEEIVQDEHVLVVLEVLGVLDTLDELVAEGVGALEEARAVGVGAFLDYFKLFNFKILF